MADEEMDMTVDFAQASYGEDIEIDLDFPAGQPDEDMDLEDFDHIHGIHNFNSDTRDELMVEGDDSSYNMVDAIDMDPNTSAVAANDIDIDLEHAVESIWQQDPHHTTDFNLDTEIDYLDETTAETMDAEKNDADTSDWVPSELNVQNTNTIDHTNEAPKEIPTEIQESHGEHLLEGSGLSPEETSEPVNLPQADAEVTHSPANSGPKADEQSAHVVDTHEDETSEAVAQDPDQPSAVEQDELGFSQEAAGTEARPRSPNSNLQESDEPHETDHFYETARIESDHTNETPAPHDPEQPEHAEATESGSVKGDQVGLLQPEETGEFADDGSEYHLDGESYTEATNDQSGADDTVQAESSAPDHFDSQSRTSPDRDPEGYHDEVAPSTGMEAPAVGIGGRDDPIELADRYGVYISYGEANYRLFAKSEDDDPNQYFLADPSALDVSLTHFLTSLREVISEEVSPLDDLVMQVDGLGLEFSESTTPDFLGKYTFGDLVVLYDKLVKNEQSESSPPIYTYLTVRPNCNRRMMALGESANAGRGLSEVALYHDSVDEEQADVGSPDTNFTTAEYNDGESGNIYLQEDYEKEGDAINDGGQQDSPSAIAEVQSEHTAESDDETGELGPDNEEASVDGSTNAINYEDFSISKQDHAASESPALQSQEADEQEDQLSPKAFEADESNLQPPKTMPTNLSTDISNSENTSVTATLDGEDRDEIDYDSDGDNESNHENIDGLNAQNHPSGTESDLNISIDDEITWESDEEGEAKNEIKGGLAKDTVQVSPVSGKRTRSDSDTLNGVDGENDHKRRRS